MYIWRFKIYLTQYKTCDINRFMKQKTFIEPGDTEPVRSDTGPGI